MLVGRTVRESRQRRRSSSPWLHYAMTGTENASTCARQKPTRELSIETQAQASSLWLLMDEALMAVSIVRKSKGRGKGTRLSGLRSLSLCSLVVLTLDAVGPIS